MPREVEYNGRVISVPDDASDDEVAEILSADNGGGAAAATPQPGLVVPPDTFERPLRAPSRPDAPKSGPSHFLGEMIDEMGLNPLTLIESAQASRDQTIDAYRRGNYGEAALSGIRTLLPFSAVPFVEGAARGAVAEDERSAQRFEAGDPVGGVFHGAASMVPVIGPRMGAIYDQAASGDNTGAAGRAAGQIVPLVAGAAAGRGKNPFDNAPQFSPDKIPMTAAERTGRLQGVSDIVESSYVGSGPFREFRLRALQQTQKIAQGLADQIAAKSGPAAAGDTPLSREASGRTISRLIDMARRKSTREVDLVEAEVNQAATPRRQVMKIRDSQGDIIPPDPNRPATAGRAQVNKKRAGDKGPVANPSTGAWVDTSSWKVLIDDIAAIVDDSHTAFPEPTRAAVRELASELRSSPRMLPWDSALRTREGIAELNRLLATNGDINPTAAGTTAQKLKLRHELALEDALRTAGGRELADKWRGAQELREANNAAFIEGVLGQLQKTKPEAVHRLLTEPSMSIDDVRVMQRHIGREPVRAMAAENIARAVRESTGTARQGGRTVDVLHPHAFADAIDAMLQDGKLQVAIADPALVRELTTLSRDARAMRTPRGIDINMLSSGNRLGQTASLLRGDVSPGVIAQAGTGIATMTGAHKLLLSADVWQSVRNALRQAAVTGAAASITTTNRERTQAEQMSRNKGSIQ